MTGSIESHRYTINRSVFTQALDEEEQYILKNVLLSDAADPAHSREILHKEFDLIRSEIGEGLYVGIERDVIAFSSQLQQRVNQVLTRTLYGETYSYSETVGTFSKLQSDIEDSSFKKTPYAVSALRGAVIGAGLSYIGGAKDIKSQQSQFVDSLKDLIHAEDKSLEKKEYYKGAKESYHKYIKSRMPGVTVQDRAATSTGRLMRNHMVVTKEMAVSAEKTAEAAKHVAKKELMKLDVMAAKTGKTVMKRAFFGGALGAVLFSLFEPSDVY